MSNIPVSKVLSIQPSPYIVSKFIFKVVGLVSKFWLLKLNRTNVTNLDYLVDRLENRNDRPIITICNHISNLDDPIIWGSLPSSILHQPVKMRWTLGASNILFTNWLYSKFFSLGKCIKIVRGDGIYQDGMNESIEKLQYNQWVHIFPEGKVNQSDKLLYFKWGLGRLIGECFKTTGKIPVLVPIYIKGLEKSMPLNKIAFPRFFKDISITIGSELKCDQVITNKEYISMKNEKDYFKKITDSIEYQYKEQFELKSQKVDKKDDELPV